MAFHRKKALAVLFVGLLPVLWMSAAEAPLKPEVKLRLAALKSGFDSFVLKTITTPYEEGLARLGDMAVTALKRESNTAAEHKDLDSLVRIKADMERLSKGQVLTDPAQSAPPAGLAPIYAAYKMEHLKLETEREAGFADARQRYDKGLGAVQDELTAQKNIEAAVYVKRLRTSLANSVVADVSTTAAGTASHGVPPMPREWTYHSGETIGSIASMAFEPDGTFLMPWKNLITPYTGTWKATKQPGIFTLVYNNVAQAGQTPFELKITGDKAQMDVPNVGMRYLRAKPAGDSSEIAGLWSCHLTQDGVPQGLLILHPDSRLSLKIKQEKQAWTGTWNDTDKPGVISMSFENHPKAGTALFETPFSGDRAVMDLPNAAGKFYLKFQGGVPTVAVRKVPGSVHKVSGIPAEWTYHSRADWYSIAWLRLLPKGDMEWHDRKGVQMCKWRRTAEGFEVDYPNEKPWIVKTRESSAGVDRAPGGPSNDFLFLKTPLDED